VALPAQKSDKPEFVVPEGQPSLQSRTETTRLRQMGVSKAKLQTPTHDARFGLGMELSEQDRISLLRCKIEARTLVTAIKQDKTGEYLLRGNDSGGSTVEMGHVVAYLGTTNAPLTLRHSFDNVIPNQTHSLVFGKELVRIEVYRYRSTYSVGVTFYMLSTALSKDGRPAPVKRSLFLERSGRLDGVPDSDPYFGLPEFVTANGGVTHVPVHLHDVVRKAVSISTCPACNHDHFRLEGPLDIDQLLTGRPPKTPRPGLTIAASRESEPPAATPIQAPRRKTGTS
jgi:hypothetical protein